MANINGRFYFKLTDSKNLIGEFSNSHQTCKRNYTESADRIFPPPELPKNSDDGRFVGNYHSTWHEENDHEAVLANLEIRIKTGCENIFSLEWRTDTTTFTGEGMLCDGMLIGNYWSVP